MESKNMHEDENKKISSLHELAQAFESQIKGVITEKFSINPEDLSLLLQDQDGVYMSSKDPNTFCCLLVGKKNGYLYLVTAKMIENGKKMSTFKCDIIS